MRAAWPSDTGLRPVCEDALPAAFDPAAGQRLIVLVPHRVHAQYHGDNGNNGAPAWFATTHRR